MRAKNSTLEDGLSPVLSYPRYPVQVTDPKPVRRRRSVSRQRPRGQFPGIKLRLAKHHVEELQACAQVTGWSFDEFLRNVLFQAREDTAGLFGMKAYELAKLSKADRATLASLWRKVSFARICLSPKSN